MRILDQVTGKDPELRQLVEDATINAYVARMIYDARTKARMTQANLAKLVGTTQSVVARLEDADYEGHSLTMLRRIAGALNKRLEVRFVPTRKRRLARAGRS